MIANNSFLNKPLSFWSNIKFINQRLGYIQRRTKNNTASSVIIPSIEDIIKVFSNEDLNPALLVQNNHWTDFGNEIIAYMEFRGNALKSIEANLMSYDEAKQLFYSLKKKLNPLCPLPINKQTKEKKDFSFLTGIVNMLIENNIGGLPCDFDPKELTAFTIDKIPVRTLSRRVDGAFPSVINPIALWEIKEYYYTTTFGSRVADGVYETQLDGWELRELKDNLNINVEHYLITDDHFTWWEKGKSYLCRIIDSLHMGLLTEALFGKEVLIRIPEIVNQWKSKYILK